MTLPATIDSPKLARQRVVRFAAEEHLDGAAEALTIIVSEMVTNAVMHGTAPIVLTLRRDDDAVRIEVRDGATDIEQVRTREIDQERPGGRGLRIVSVLADDWGVEPTSRGKVIWAVYRPRAGA